MDECSQQQHEFITPLVALRKRASEHRFDDQTGVLLELMQFIDHLESAAPADVLYQTALDVARSLAVLRRPLSALERVESLLCDGPQKKGGNELVTFEAAPSRYVGIGSPTSNQKRVGCAPDATELAMANAHITVGWPA